MKKNFPRKKLDLNKQTIVTLNSGEIKRIWGGSERYTDDGECTTLPIPTCDPCTGGIGVDPTTH